MTASLRSYQKTPCRITPDQGEMKLYSWEFQKMYNIRFVEEIKKITWFIAFNLEFLWSQNPNY